jgi:4-hydroxy-tetrahydrodipicolinate synthase
MKSLRGAGAALISPFTRSGAIDFDAFENILQHTSPHLDFLVLLGTTGESATCSAEEKEEIIAFAVEKLQGKIPLVVGSGGNDTAKIKKELKHYEKYPISAILSVSPYYNRPTQEGIFRHYSELAEVSSFPIILYNVPLRTASNIKAETTLRLAQNPKIIGIKEASGDFTQCLQILKNRPEGFLLLSGDDALTVPLISLGADGVIAVLANAFPKEFADMTHAALNGNFEKAGKIARDWADLYPLMF